MRQDVDHRIDLLRITLSIFIPPFLKFSIRRLLVIPVTLLVITALLYSVVMFTPPEARAQLYLRHVSARITDAQLKTIMDRIIIDHGLDQSYPIQYVKRC